MTDHNNHTIYRVFAQVLKVPVNALTDETRREHLEAWDSLSHLLLVAALSEEFGVQIPPEAALDMESIADVQRIILALQAAQGGNVNHAAG